MTICLDCKHAGMKVSPKHTAVAIAPCKANPGPGVFMTLTRKRECTSFATAPADTRKARHDWFDKSRGN